MKKKILNCTVITFMFLASVPLFATNVCSDNKQIEVSASSDIHDHTGYTNWGSDVSETTQLPSEPGSYYLSSDITLSGFWQVPVGTTNLCLNGHVIKNDGSNCVIKVLENATLNLYDCGEIIHNGYVDANGLWHLDENREHALESSETERTINGGIITGGVSLYGGGINNDGTLNMFGGTIAGCNCLGDEGLADTYSCGGGVANFLNFVMSGGTITGCTAFANGGGVYNAGTFKMEGGLIEKCRTASTDGGKGLGGGVYNYSGGTAILSGGEIKNNESARHGGGIQNCGSSATLSVAKLIITGGSILNNKVPKGGGGINSDGTILMSGGLVSGNEAGTSNYGGGIRFNGANTSTLVFGGSAKVVDNKVNNFRNNLYLCEYKLLTVGTKTSSSDGNEVDKPTSEMLVGVSTYQNESKFGKECLEGDEKYFFPDDQLFISIYEDGYLKRIRKNTGHLLPEDFPTKTGDDIPENAWINENGAKLYINSGTKEFYANNTFFITGFTSETPILHSSDTNEYYYSYTRGSITLKMVFNLSNEYSRTVESITTSGINGSDPLTDDIFGTYKPLEIVTKPNADTSNFVYDGTAKTYNIPSSDAYIVSGNTQTAAGNYTVTVTLKNVYQYKWADGTTEPLTYSFVINNKAEDVKVRENGKEIDPANAKVSIIEAENGIDPNAIFVVEVVEMEQAEDVEVSKKALEDNNKIAENEKIFGIYDAKLLIDGAEVQPNGTITIKMFVPEEIQNSNFELYHIHNATEVLNVVHSQMDDSGFITFTTNKLSQFAFVSEVANPIEPEPQSEGTGLGTGAIIGIVLGSLFLLLLLIYIAGYFFLYRKGKLDEKKIKVIYKFLPRGNKNLEEQNK